MKTRRPSPRIMLIVQAAVCAAFAIAFARQPDALGRGMRAAGLEIGAFSDVPVTRDVVQQVEPLYDDPQVVSDEELAMVLGKVRPRFSRRHLRPNYVEHALRTWGADATFADDAVLSGREMVEFLSNHGRYAKSWGGDTPPLLINETGGVAVRWGDDPSASVHHDHLLASLSEAGVHLQEKVVPPGNRTKTFGSLLQQALRDFRIDERETEWSAMAFALWLPPQTKAWRNSAGRRITFDLLAARLMRGDARLGVCSGTHRLYSLALLWRVDRRHGILSPGVRAAARDYLQRMRDAIAASQFPDGHWASDWARGEASRRRPVDEPEYKAVIATGHHLEWLAIAPPEFQPPREVVRKAARWLVQTTAGKSRAEVLARYTFYSHVGNALTLWRKTRPAEFWTRHVSHRNTANGP